MQIICRLRLYLKQQLGGETVIGADIDAVQKVFGPIFHAEDGFKTDGSQFDILPKDGDVLMLGDMKVTAIHTPGHTPACMSYHIGDAVFVGDTLFMPDFGTARCDFPGGSAETLYTAPSKNCSPCRTKPVSSCVTITKHRAVMSINGKPPLAQKKPATNMWAATQIWRLSSKCAQSAMRSLVCPN